VYVVPMGICLFVVVKEKPTVSCTPVRRLWVRMRHVIPVGMRLFVVVEGKTHWIMKASAYVVPVGIRGFVVVKKKNPIPS